MELIALDPDMGLLLLRLGLALIFFVHGPMKLWHSQEMGKEMGLPSALIFLVGLMESSSALAMLVGSYTQFAAFMLIAVMLGAIYMKTQQWGKKFTGDGGYEFDTIILLAAFTIMLAGPGGFAYPVG